jgi:tRNA (guanosine-2'-O-)-methyltransferase
MSAGRLPAPRAGDRKSRRAPAEGVGPAGGSPGAWDLLVPFATEARIERLTEVLKQRTSGIVLILDRLYDPHNLSAILRTAEAFGIQEVHLSESWPETTNPQVALGAERWLTVRRWPDPRLLLDDLRARGFSLALTSPEGDGLSPEAFHPGGPVALILGNEREGAAPFWVSRADARLTLPLRGFVRSLNVSVAAGIFLWSLVGKPALGVDLPEETAAGLRDRWIRLSVPNAKKILVQLGSPGEGSGKGD